MSLNFIEDQAGNRMKANIQPTLSVSETTVDTVIPRILSVTKNHGVKTHVELGTIVDLVAHFSEPVLVTGSPRFILSIGGQSAASALYQNTGVSTYSETHTFRYIVGEGHNGSLQVTGLNLDQDNFIQDRAENPVEVNIQPPLSVSGVNVDTTFPIVSSVTKKSGTGVHVGKDTEVDLIVEFNEPVMVTGSPNLILNISGGSTIALYQNTEVSTYSETHTFRYTVGEDHNGSIQVTGLGLSQDNFIRDRTGNPAEVNIQPSLPVRGVKVDTTSPLISSVTKKSGTGAHVGKDTDVDLVVEFNEPVMVTGNPSLTLSIGEVSATSALYQDTGVSTYSRHHTFRYTVGEGHNGDIQITGLNLDQDNFIQR